VLASNRRNADSESGSFASFVQAFHPSPPLDPESEEMPVKHPKARREDRDYEDLVRLYLEDVGRHDLLTKDDEIRLAQAIEQPAPGHSPG
jgi:hypothetical protein